MRDYNKAPVIKLKLPIYKNKKSCDIFEHNGIPIDLNMINRSMKMIKRIDNDETCHFEIWKK